MKAIQISRFGGPEVLEPIDIPKPAPGPGEVLIRVGAVGVNFFETLQRQDRYGSTPSLPMIPGVEVAGTVEALGTGASGVGIGARVAAPLFAAGIFSGGYAEHVAADAGWTVPLPASVSFATATALMVQGLTALHLTRQAPPAGKTVLVNAAAGGVGSLLVQLARRAGARRVIAAASSPEKLAAARELGADAGIDYSRPDWTAEVQAAAGGAGVEVIYESIGGAITTTSFGLLAPLGRIVLFGALNLEDFGFGVPELASLVAGNQSLAGFSLLPLLSQANVKADLAALFSLAERGELTVLPGSSFPLEQAAAAHHALESRRSTGKLVLVP
ncbi:zinc-binding alcohol dehydrogenase family protein [Bosea caraganae]|uniref:Zinc-binding alcohol dehydrogenase family protein n=1 Tax=Bosea caraganae TaxID=2763117 RepID=A0A370L7L7_9HYPH|nr:zinc-binding dehydrogenase [Bosea caraganae]RDJ25053.1 zinc-binding alcohol dehydrogenase family protein [Bosea caraganae]RDJ26163.1 zinc-binding alcohol dehydrogenase family protein [Bosea caraganae]